LLAPVEDPTITRVINSQRILSNFRRFSWVALIALTAGLLFFPVRWTREIGSIEPLELIQNPGIFATIFILWFCLLVYFLYTSSSRRRLLALLLLFLFLATYAGFWIIHRPTSLATYGSDSVVNIASARVIMLEAGIRNPGGRRQLSLGFPGLHVTAAAVSLISGLDLFSTVGALFIVLVAAHASAIYWFSSLFLGGGSSSTIAALLFLLGNPQTRWMGQFHPTHFNVIFFVLLVCLAFRQIDVSRPLGVIVPFILLAGAASVNHPLTIWAFLFVLIAWLTFDTGQASRHQTRSLVVPLATISLVWLASWASAYLQWALSSFTSTLLDVVSDPLRYIRLLARPGLTGAVPGWVVFVELAWYFLLSGFGAVLAVLDLVRFRSLPLERRLASSAVAGIFLFTLLTMVTVGSSEYYRFLQFGSVFTVCILIGRMVTTHSRLARMSASFVLLGTLIALAWPTFLTSYRAVGTISFFPADLSAGLFLEDAFGRHGPVTIFSGNGEALGLYFFPFATIISEGEPRYMRNAEGFRGALERWGTTFHQTLGSHEPLFLIVSKRLQSIYASQYFNDELSVKQWAAVSTTLDQSSPSIYANGRITVYVP
jgi:hypothetical protein